MLTLTCPKCSLDIMFEIDGPDYDVGIIGYMALMAGSQPDGCQCTFTEREIDELEMQASEMAATCPN